jgi:CBS domain-containing protein
VHEEGRMQIKDSMKTRVISIKVTSNVGEAINVASAERVGTLPVVDAENYLLGVVSINDLARLFLPDFVFLVEDIDFVGDYGALEMPSPEEVARIKEIPVRGVMKVAVVVEEDCAPMRALSVMEKHRLQDLPVVKEGRLVGIASRVDIFRQLFGPLK